MNNYATLPTLSPTQTLVDTHCHLDMSAYENDFEKVLSDAKISGIGHIITIGIDLISSKKAIDLAIHYSQISATIGIHPHDVDNINNSTYDALKKLHNDYSEHIVAYGEIGLDYVKNYSDQKTQRQHFSHQLLLAAELKLPVVVHNREAEKDTLRILQSATPLANQGVMHCFSGDYDFARQVLDLGFYISIPGVVTFKNAKILQDVVKRIPLDRIVCETDGPFLAPHPFRGKRNTPAHLLFTAQKIAELRGTDINTIAEATTKNAKILFNFK